LEPKLAEKNWNTLLCSERRSLLCRENRIGLSHFEGGFFCCRAYRLESECFPTPLPLCEYFNEDSLRVKKEGRLATLPSKPEVLLVCNESYFPASKNRHLPILAVGGR